MAMLMALAGCGSKSEEPAQQVAATVNGVEIYESDVTGEVESRREDLGLADDAEWQAYLSDRGMLIDDFRMQVVEDMVDNELIRQGASSLGIEATTESAEAEVRAYFQNSASEGEGGTQESLMYFLERYDGAKRSSHILIKANRADGVEGRMQAKQKANDLLGQIESGAISFEDAARSSSDEQETAAAGGDVGWDCDVVLADAYQDVLDELSPGEVSEIIESELGYHIVKCTESCELQDAQIDSIDDLPEGIRDAAEQFLQHEAGDRAFETWLENLREAASININPMPDWVPYGIMQDDGESGDSASRHDDDDEDVPDNAYDGPVDTAEEATDDGMSDND